MLRLISRSLVLSTVIIFHTTNARLSLKTAQQNISIPVRLLLFTIQEVPANQLMFSIPMF